MRKFIWISLILLLTVSCGSRKAKIEKNTEKQHFETEQKTDQTVETSTTTESNLDLSTFFENQNISIAGDGTPFTINYRGFVYQGSAPIEISNKKEEKRIKLIQKTQTVYKSVISYKTETTYKSVVTEKKKETDRKAVPVWVWILLGMAIPTLIQLLWKAYVAGNPIFKIFKK